MRGWYKIIYYILLVYSAILGGALITVMLMPLNATNNLITLAHPQKEDSHLIMTENLAE